MATNPKCPTSNSGWIAVCEWSETTTTTTEPPTAQPKTPSIPDNNTGNDRQLTIVGVGNTSDGEQGNYGPARTSESLWKTATTQEESTGTYVDSYGDTRIQTKMVIYIDNPYFGKVKFSDYFNTYSYVKYKDPIYGERTISTTWQLSITAIDGVPLPNPYKTLYLQDSNYKITTTTDSEKQETVQVLGDTSSASQWTLAGLEATNQTMQVALTPPGEGWSLDSCQFIFCGNKCCCDEAYSQLLSVVGQLEFCSYLLGC